MVFVVSKSILVSSSSPIFKSVANIDVIAVWAAAILLALIVPDAISPPLNEPENEVADTSPPVPILKMFVPKLALADKANSLFPPS